MIEKQVNVRFSIYPVAHECASRSVVGTAFVLGFSLLAIGVQRYDAPLILAAMTAACTVAILALRPDWATIIVVFVLYTNIPALASGQGVPSSLASSFMLLLAIPLLYCLIGRRQPIRADATLVLMFLLLIVMALSALGASRPDLASARIHGFMLEGLVLYLLVINVVRSASLLRRVLWTMLFAGSLLGGLTLYQEVSGVYSQEFGGLAQRNHEWIELRNRTTDPYAREMMASIPQSGRSKRPGGPVAEPNRFAQILLVLLPFAVLMYRLGRSSLYRFIAFTTGSLILAGLVLTHSRGAFVTLVMLFGLMALWQWIRPSHALIALILVSVTITVLEPAFVERVRSITDVTYLRSDNLSDQQQADGAIRGRTTQMLAAVHMFIDHPILGVGPGQFGGYLEEYSQRPEIKFREIRTPRRAHSLYLEIAAETGVVGLLVFFSAVGVLFRQLWDARRYWIRRDPECADLATGFLLSLMAYLGTGLFLHLSYQRYYWLLLAVTSAAVHILDARRFAQSGQTDGVSGHLRQVPRVGCGSADRVPLYDGGLVR